MKYPASLLFAFACLVLWHPVFAGDVFKVNNTNALNQTSSWSTAALPGSGDVAVWDAPFAQAGQITFGTLSQSWSGIRVASPTVLPVIRSSSGYSLTLGSAGIDMSASTQGFTINQNVTAGANQSWNTAASRVLTVASGVGGVGVTITKAGAGTLKLSGGSDHSPVFQLNEGTLNVSPATGTLILSGGISGSGGTLLKDGTGALTLSGNSSTFSGVINLTAGQLNLNHANAIGTATLNITGGTLDNTSGVSVTLASGNQQNWNSNITFIGSNPLALSGSAVTVDGSRTVTVSAGSLSLGSLTSHPANGGSLTKGGGGLLAVPAGASIDLDGKIATTAGTFRISGGNVACGSSTGNFEIGGGGMLELQAGSLTTRAISQSSASANLRFDGGTLKARADNGSFLTGLDNATIAGGGAVVDIDGWILTIAQPMLHDPALGASPDGGLWIADSFGNGTLTLTGTSTYTGPTFIEAGKLAIGPGGSISSSPIIEIGALGTLDAGSNTTLAAGQTLQGTGTVTGTLTIGVGATIAPAGGVIGDLNATDTLNLAGNAVFQLHKSGSTLTHDSVQGLGHVAYGGTLTATATGNPLALGDSFQLFDAAIYSGGFTSLDLPALSSGLYWETAGLLVDGSIQVINTLPQPVFNPPAGACFASQMLSITGAGGSTIHYTMDGSDPVTSPTKISALSPVTGISVPAGGNSFTIRAYSSLAGYPNSAVAVADYNVVEIGTWITPGSGIWSDAPNWLDGLIAQGAGITADFSTVELSANATVALDTSRVIGNLKFGSTNGVADWTLVSAGGAMLTLDAAPFQPFIEVVNRSATISSIVAGTQGFEKTGPGTLVLTAANTISGDITISGGTLRVGNGGTSASLGSSPVVNDGILEFHSSDTYTIPNTISGTGKIHVKSGGTLSLTGALTAATLRAHEGGSRTVILGGTQPNTIQVLETNQDGHCVWVFAKSAGVNAFSGPVLDVGIGYNSTSRLRLDNDEQIADATTVKLYGTQPYYSGHNYFDLNGRSETIAGVVSTNVWTHVANGAAPPSVLTLAGGDTYSFVGSMNNGSTGTFSIGKTGTGTQTFSGDQIDYTGPTTVTNGRLILLNNDDTWTSAYAISSGAVVEINRAAGVDYEHRNAFTLSGAGTLEKTGGGTMDMNWDQGGTVAMSPGGLIHIKEGTLRLGYGSLSNWTNNKGDLTIETGATFDLWDNNLTTAGVVVDALNGGGSIVRSTYGNTGNLTVGVDGGGGEFSGSISNASGVIHLIKQGGGTQILSGANTCTGTTTVAGGTLLINNTSGSGTGSGNVTINSPARLGGTGSISGAVTVNSGAFIAPGSNGVGALATGATTLDGTYQCQVTGATTDQLDVTGDLDLTGSSLVVSTIGAVTPGTYVIATFTGTRTGTFGSVTSGYTVNYSTPNQVKLVVTGTVDPYQTWIDGFTFAPGADKTPTGDPENDGIPNGVEMVLGGNPATGMDAALLPTIQMVTNPAGVPAGHYLLFTYRRTDLSVDAGVLATCETDDDLVAPWTTVTGTAPEVIQVDDNYSWTNPSATNTDRVRVYVPSAANTELFGRLNVNVP